MARPNFSDDTKLDVLDRAKWICECGTKECADDPVTTEDVFDFHHKIPNTKVNQKRYGEKLQSKENAALLRRKCHLNGKILTRLRKETEETWGKVGSDE